MQNRTGNFTSVDRIENGSLGAQCLVVYQEPLAEV